MRKDTVAYWVQRAGVGTLEIEDRPVVRDGELELRTLVTGISPGTERLVGLGRVPNECRESMRCAYMGGSFVFPLKYGYSLVGLDERGRRFFVMHPHQSRVSVRSQDLIEIPESIPDQRAALFPALETAQNAIWDASLAPTERVAVVGGGLIALAVGFLLRELYRHPITLIEENDQRREYLRKIPWIKAYSTASFEGTPPDKVFHCSASSRGLQWCVDHSAFEATIVELSWYGTQNVDVNLGAAFHHGRKALLSSQVSHVARPVRDKIDRQRRSLHVLEHLQNPLLDHLLQPVYGIEALPELMAAIYQKREQFLAPLVVY
ncbi:MAG: zinc-binding alcohol dehydrogenase [Pseudomonadota bacterium]